ncbi:hypothetical protein LCGC14_0799440 [marine sediment metagenome]|uniref:Uncharacterized protein n=1 Tax=marine sediment metagenome TaxID=412755 RepID=A0A0F9PUL1_9ZZZZ
MAEQRCECGDTRCPAHPGIHCTQTAVEVVYRIDFKDSTGTHMCFACTEDAMESGLYTISEDFYEGSACPAPGEHLTIL